MEISRLLSAAKLCCLTIFSACNTPDKKRTADNCTDTLKHVIHIDSVSGFHLRWDVVPEKLVTYLSFEEKAEFTKWFQRASDTTQPLNFDDYWYVAVVIDNKIDQMGANFKVNKGVPVETICVPDTAYIQKCELNVPFLFATRQPLDYLKTTEKTHCIMLIPRSACFKKVYMTLDNYIFAGIFDAPDAD